MSWVDDPCLQDQNLIQVAPVSLGPGRIVAEQAWI